MRFLFKSVNKHSNGSSCIEPKVVGSVASKSGGFFFQQEENTNPILPRKEWQPVDNWQKGKKSEKDGSTRKIVVDSCLWSVNRYKGAKVEDLIIHML